MLEIILKGKSAQDYLDYGKAIEVAKLDSNGAVITYDAYEALLDSQRAEVAVAEQEEAETEEMLVEEEVTEEPVVTTTPTNIVPKSHAPWTVAEEKKLLAAMKEKTPSRKKITWLVDQLKVRSADAIKGKVSRLGGYVKNGSVYI